MERALAAEGQHMHAVLLLHVLVTLVMVGLIWFVQVVHYPLFGQVGRDTFAAYEAEHMRRTTWVVAAPMLVELATGILLLWQRPAGVPAWMAWVGIALLAVIWASTVWLQVPCHEALRQGFSDAAHAELVRTNWVRTVAWSLRGLLVLGMMSQVKPYC